VLFRSALGISQTELAKAMGVSLSAVQGWINEKFQPRPKALAKIEAYLQKKEKEAVNGKESNGNGKSKARKETTVEAQEEAAAPVEQATVEHTPASAKNVSTRHSVKRDWDFVVSLVNNRLDNLVDDETIEKAKKLVKSLKNTALRNELDEENSK
jgi:transcriptional regulator with XRE-family HTH domain